VYDKTVRRRRAVLALLVVLSLILLTAYFGEAQGGRLHSAQRVFLTVVSPIQDGANKALKPVRDLFGWFGDTLHAKGQRDQLRKQVNQLRAKAIANEADERSYRELLKLYRLDTTQLKVSDYTPVTATVVDKSPNIWYSTVTIDKGEADGVRVNDPVINGEGLVGKVTQAASDGAVVSLITDSSVGVSARINATGAVGIVQPEVGDPGRLLLQYLPASTPVSPGQYVVTSGTVSSGEDSLFPRGIAIGQVTSVDERSPYKSVNVRPLADLHNLDVVQVLTFSSGSHAAGLTRLAANAGVSG
jgi:rod shape-determining protein MreC